MYGKSERLEDYEHVAGTAQAMMTTMVSGMVRPFAPAARGRLFISQAGALQFTVDGQLWVLGPGGGLWVPPESSGSFVARSRCRLVVVFVAPAASKRLLREAKRVIVSPLLSALSHALAEAPLGRQDARSKRMARLLVGDIHYLPVAPIELPLPSLPRLKQLCVRMREDPGAALPAAAEAREMGMSPRTFGRRFEREAGMSYAAWSRSAKILHALTQIAKGDSVYNASIAAGFSGASSFCSTFRRVAGMTPKEYFDSEGSLWDSDETMFG